MNVSDQLSQISAKFPDKTSIVAPIKNNNGYVSYSFSELERKVNQISNRLTKLGVKQKDIVLIFLKPDIHFAATVFACFKLGAVCTFIDPGMGKNKLLQAIKESGARVLIGITKIHIIRRFFPRAFASIELFISTSTFGLFSKSLHKKLGKESYQFKSYSPKKEELAALLYTSGGTGKPKAVKYTHEIFIEQTKKLQAEFSLTEKDIDIPGFPLFSFFTLCMGMKSVIPFMDPARPSQANPADLIKNIQDHKATYIAGSPAIWKNMIDYCIDREIQLSSVRCFVMFGAPIPYETHQKIKSILPNGTSYTPYGATECLPVSNISGKTILKNYSNKTIEGKGICIGHTLDGVNAKIIAIEEQIIPDISLISEMKSFEIGEIIACSSTVTPGYKGATHATEMAKIKDGDMLWHRMGDTGYKDDDNNLWFTGRLAHSFIQKGKRRFVIPVEQYFLNIVGVNKAALVSLNEKESAIVLEGSCSIEKAFSIIDKHDLGIQRVLFHEHFPVDVRHNIKIDRKELTAWAKERTK